jgi:hypothetical protein
MEAVRKVWHVQRLQLYHHDGMFGGFLYHQVIVGHGPHGDDVVFLFLSLVIEPCGSRQSSI